MMINNDNTNSTSLVVVKVEENCDKSKDNTELDFRIESVNEKTGKRQRRQKADPWKWAKNLNKKKRMLGEEYIGSSFSKESQKPIQVVKEGRKLGLACTSNFCKKTKNRHCSEFTEQNRQDIFDEFWKMSWIEKKAYVMEMTAYEKPSRTYTKTPSRRSGTYHYYLNHENDQKLQVCQHMFLSTLGIKERTVHYWMSEVKKPARDDKIEQVNKKINHRKKNEIDTLAKFLEELPKMENQCCKLHSNRLYLTDNIKCKTEVYYLYVRQCDEKNEKALSYPVFHKMFNNLNLALLKNGADQCSQSCDTDSLKVHPVQFDDDKPMALMWSD